MNIFDLFYGLCGIFFVDFCPISNQTQMENITEENDTPLFLTPLIESGNIAEARNASLVKFHKFYNMESYSGLLTVNKSANSNMFFWYFPALFGYPDTPVVLWLQGGPGSTGLFGLFNENGPFYMTKFPWLGLRSYSWNVDYAVIYIDNPVGSGFSFTDDENAYPTNQEEMSTDLYAALIQILQLFPEIQTNDFYVFGESYGGKYIPAIGYKILKENPKASIKINLQGLGIGNGMSDPINQLDYAEYLYELSLIDLDVKKQVEDLQEKAKQMIHEEKWIEATDAWNDIMDFYTEITDGISPYNFISNSSEDLSYPEFLNRSDTRKALHVGALTFNDSSEVVYSIMYGDIMKSITPWISELLSHYRILFYNGQLDVMVPYVFTDNFLRKLNFSGADDLKTAKRKPWRAQGQLAGFYKVAGNLTQLLLRNSGHMAPGDQPSWTYEMLRKFISGAFH